MTHLEIQYLLQFWDILYESHPDVSTNIVDHHGELIVQNGALVESQWVLQQANMVNFFSQRR
jgi:hypothetical protein